MDGHTYKVNPNGISFESQADVMTENSSHEENNLSLTHTNTHTRARKHTQTLVHMYMWDLYMYI